MDHLINVSQPFTFVFNFKLNGTISGALSHPLKEIEANVQTFSSVALYNFFSLPETHVQPCETIMLWLSFGYSKGVLEVSLQIPLNPEGLREILRSCAPLNDSTRQHPWNSDLETGGHLIDATVRSGR